MPEKKFAIVACGILKEEIKKLLADGEIEGGTPFFLSPALHLDPDRLENQLNKMLTLVSKKFSRIVVVYGRCHPNMDDIVKAYNAQRVVAQNCIEMLLGTQEYEKRMEEGVFFLSPGWCEVWREMFVERLKWDRETAVETLKNANIHKSLLLHTEVVSDYAEKASDFSNYFSVPLEKQKVSLDNLRHLILAALERTVRK